MRAGLAVVMAFFIGAGCGDDAQSAKHPDAAVDAPQPIDAVPACQPTPLLVAGTDLATQKWKVVQSQPSTLTNPPGADFIQIDTSTTGNAPGGELLLSFTSASALAPPFKLAIVMKVVSLTAHPPDPLDAAAAIMPSFSGLSGSQTEREQMVSIESTKIGCGDGKPSVPATLVDGAFHTYTLAVDANKTMTVTLDDQATPVITRAQITLGGTFAIGDQTNDPNVDSSLQIRSITKLCL